MNPLSSASPPGKGRGGGTRSTDFAVDSPLIFFHTPRTRSTAIRALLEELAIPYTLRLVDLRAGEQLQPSFLAVNPQGKVPAVRQGEALVTEQVALTLWLADMAPAAGLAPLLDDPLRGPYLRWLAFYGSAFEPAVVDHALGRQPGTGPLSLYRSFETVLDTVEAQLAPGPWLLGARFTAADILWAWGLSWTSRAASLPTRPAFTAYAERVRARPAFQRAWAADLALLANTAAS